MKALFAILAGLMIGQSALAAPSTPFRLNTADYNDFRNTQGPVTFVAIAKVQKKDVEAFKAVVESLVGTMRAQQGNIYYEMHQSLTDSTEFLFLEEWESGKDMADHMDSAAVKELVAKAGAMFKPGFPKFLVLKKN